MPPRPIRLDSLAETILRNRSNITQGSLQTYLGCLKRIVKNLAPELVEPKLEFFLKSTRRIIEFLETAPMSSAKTTFAALVVLTQEHPKTADVYRAEMNRLSEIYRESEKHQTLSKNEVFVPWTELQEQYKEMMTKLSPLFSTKQPNFQIYLILRDLVVASVYMLIPPRRIKDFTHFKLKDVDKKVDNYFQDGAKPKFVFNTYKTSKHYGPQEVEIPPELYQILKQFLKVNKWTYLFNTATDAPMSQSQLTRCLNRIFGDRVSVNVLRHSYISEFLKDAPKLTEMEKLAKDMGHSVVEQQFYRRA